MTADEPNAASRLCSACGMCCNGVMFYGAVLQPSDNPRLLASLGVKVKRKNKELNLLQPCTAHDGCNCTIYAHRPTRCRLFECRQLKALAAGEVSEQDALEKILEARRLTDRVRQLLLLAGDTRENKALSTRYDSVFTEPLDTTEGSEEIRGELKIAMGELGELLREKFRL